MFANFQIFSPRRSKVKAKNESIALPKIVPKDMINFFLLISV